MSDVDGPGSRLEPRFVVMTRNERVNAISAVMIVVYHSAVDNGSTKSKSSTTGSGETPSYLPVECREVPINVLGSYLPIEIASLSSIYVVPIDATTRNHVIYSMILK
jgi:hypothetical protein